MTTSILRLAGTFALACVLIACDRSELGKVNAQQLTSEEQANILLFAPLAKGVANTLYQYDRSIAQASSAQSAELAQAAYAQAAAVLERERVVARQTSYDPPEWRQIVPDSMNGMVYAAQGCGSAFRRIQQGTYVSDDELVRVLREFHATEAEFRALTMSRPLQPAGSASPSAYLYVSLRGTPVIFETTRGEMFLGPVVPIGPFDVNPVIGPIGSSAGGTPLQRLVIRDPATKTQRAWMLNNRMPRLSIPASYIETEGTDLVITPR